MRALLLVLDSVGCGDAPDAAVYNDEQADTLGHIFAASPHLQLPALFSLGLWKILTADVFDPRSQHTAASYGRMRQRSAGKDSTTGHWEMAGVILDKPFATFESFPRELLEAIETEAQVKFIGNYRQSGTVILEELGPKHLQTRQPIVYTSADSVLQIAAHEDVMSSRQLHELCRIARHHANPFQIARIIARPFRGKPGSFSRTSHRRDFSSTPPRTILNAIADTGRQVKSVGKVRDLFAGSGITQSHPTHSNRDGMQTIEALWTTLDEGLIFANLIDFDTLYGHRRDREGYTRALIEFDKWLLGFLEQIEPEDLLIVTADHGNDPTFTGTDHTREEVPLMIVHDGLCVPLGTRKSFTDVAASLGDFFGLREKWQEGTSFLRHPIPTHGRA